MDISIKKLLGIAGDEKRIYRFVDGEVQREEFEYCQLLDQLVFGERGYVDTLGQTWGMIHDPRFTEIENKFIVSRKAVFGGDAQTGKQYMSSDGVFISTIADLEEYSEVLGEGRYFWLVLTHPEERCPVRLWYERIYPDMLANKGAKAPQAGNLRCACGPLLKLHASVEYAPRSLMAAPDEYLWALIRQECPNYFTKKDEPNGVAKRLFALFRADLVGLIADYSPTPLVDAYIELDSGDVVHDNEYTKDPNEQAPRVFLEVDLLEKALTYRATMRATAARILRQLGIESHLQKLGDARLTEEERDWLLRIVYRSKWPDEKVDLMSKLLAFTSGVTMRPYEERLKEHLAGASKDALEDCQDLLSGKLEPINSYTEPSIDVQLDPHAAIMDVLLRNPLKQELFIIWAAAEVRMNGPDETDCLNMRKLNSILTPVFTDPDFAIDGEKYWELLEEAKKLGYYKQAVTAAQVEGAYVPDEDAFYQNRKLRESRGEVRTPLPPDEPGNLAVAEAITPEVAKSNET